MKKNEDLTNDPEFTSSRNRAAVELDDSLTSVLKQRVMIEPIGEHVVVTLSSRDAVRLSAWIDEQVAKLRR